MYEYMYEYTYLEQIRTDIDDITSDEGVAKVLEDFQYLQDQEYNKSSHKMISFEYYCGVLGGMMLEDFDPYLN